MTASVRLSLSVALLFSAAATVAAQPWPAGGLTIRTNGSTFREGECVRVSLLGIEDVQGPLVPQVSYEFEMAFTVKGQDGQERTLRRRQLVERPAGTMLERVGAGTSAVVDDTFCFGFASTPGAYELTVSLLSGTSRAGALTTCVEYQPQSGPAALPRELQNVAPVVSRCDFALRGVSRPDDPSILRLEGEFPSLGLYRLLFLRGDRILFVQEGGWVAVGPGELSFVIPALGAEDTGQVDLLLQDESQSRSALLAGVSLVR